LTKAKFFLLTFSPKEKVSAKLFSKSGEKVRVITILAIE